MSFLIRSALLTCKRLLKRPGTALLLVLLPLLCFGLGSFFASGQEALTIRAGIVLLEEGDPFTEGIYTGMDTQNSPVEFVRYTPEELPQVESLVASGSLDCAFLLEPGLPRQVELGRWRDKITLLKSPSSVGHVLAGEMLFSSFFRSCAPIIGENLLEEELGIPPAEAAAYVAEQFARYGEMDIFMEPVFTVVSADGSRSAPPAGARALHGLVALFLLACILYSLPALIRDRDAVLLRLPPKKARAYLLGCACGLALVVALQGLLGLGALALVHPGALGGIGAEIGWLAAYLLALSLAGVGVGLLLSKGELFYVAAPFLLLLTAVLGGVFLDMGEIGPLFGALGRLFPSAGYLAGAMGTGAHPASLIAASAVGLGLILLLPVGAKRRKF